jgi:hypothetical protein
VSSDSFNTTPASAETRAENKKANKRRKTLEASARGRKCLVLDKLLHNIGARRSIRFLPNNRTSGISLPNGELQRAGWCHGIEPAATEKVALNPFNTLYGFAPTQVPLYRDLRPNCNVPAPYNPEKSPKHSKLYFYVFRRNSELNPRIAGTWRRHIVLCTLQSSQIS